MPKYPAVERIEDLRALFPPPTERARLKTLHRLDPHCRRFISLSPLVCMGTHGPHGADVTPRGGPPGFVHVLDDVTLSIPEWPGNNRLDSLANLITNPSIGLLFLVPGVDETLRVNGATTITTAPDLLATWQTDGRQPRAAMVIDVAEAFLHCGKALIRSRVWHEDAKIDRAALPPYGHMLKDQIEIAETAEEIQASIARGYRERLY